VIVCVSMKTKFLSLLGLLIALSTAQAGEFQFACTDASTAPKLTIAGTSIAQPHFFGEKYKISATVQIKVGGNITMNDPIQEDPHSDTSNLQDATNTNSLTFTTGALDLTGTFGFGQLSSLPSDGKFPAHATVTLLNGQAATADLSNLSLNCLGTIGKLQGDAFNSFWSSLASDAVNGLAPIVFPQDGN
jgi:hypothetical protein